MSSAGTRLPSDNRAPREAPAPAAEARGVALVAALLVMVAISVIATTLMMSVQTNIKLSALEVRETQALRIAEAGVAEAVSRLRHGDIPDDGFPRRVTQIFLVPAERLPVVGSDSIAMGTGQPERQWLTYSTALPGPDALTIEYRTDAARTRVLRYDGSQNQPVQSHSGSAIYRITSTGRKGEARRRIVTEVTQKAFDLKLKGAIAAGAGVEFPGQAVVCGFNHRIDTPEGTGGDGQTGPGGCNENPALRQWETGLDDLPGIWSAGAIHVAGTAQSLGSPPRLENQASFDAGPWEVLGLEREDFYTWAGRGLGAEPRPPVGLVHLDDNSTEQDQSGSFSYHGGDGTGFLYVDGDLTLSGSFTYRGLIYVEGRLRVNGDAWVLGAVVARGGIEQRGSGRVSVLYSRDAVGQCVPRGRNSILFLSWREVAH